MIQLRVTASDQKGTITQERIAVERCQRLGVDVGYQAQPAAGKPGKMTRIWHEICVP